MGVAEELEVTLASDARFAEPSNAALVSLCRLLADQVKSHELSESAPPTHLLAAYLSALKDLRRIQETAKGAGNGGEVEGSGSGKPTLAGIRAKVTPIRAG